MTRPDLAATAFLDFGSPEVAEFVSTAVPDGARTPTEQAVALFYAVRDRIRYEVYGADLSCEGLRASRVVRTRSGMCLHKSVLYAAGLRSLGIPAKLALANVRNHLASARLRDLMGATCSGTTATTWSNSTDTGSGSRRYSAGRCAGCTGSRRWSSTAAATASSIPTT